MPGPSPYPHLPGTARAALSFYGLAQDGTVVDPLATKPWGAADGQVVDRYGVRWLIGYEGS